MRRTWAVNSRARSSATRRQGRVRIRKPRPIENRGVSDREKLYLDSIEGKNEGGDIELFS